MSALIPADLRGNVGRFHLEDGLFTVADFDPEVHFLEALPGQNALKPVVRRVDNGQLVPGSGRYPMANNPAAIANQNTWKLAESYREALNQRFPHTGIGPDGRSLDTIVDSFLEACNGSPQYVVCGHPGCEKKHMVAFKKEAAPLYKFIELLVGPAPKVIEVKGTLDMRLRDVVATRTEVPVVITMSKEEWEAREQQLITDGVIEREWLEGEYTDIVDPADEPKLAE